MRNLFIHFSFPLTSQLNNQTKFSIVPGLTFMPGKIGDKNIGKNFYGNNYFLATGLTFDLATNLQINKFIYIFIWPRK